MPVSTAPGTTDARAGGGGGTCARFLWAHAERSSAASATARAVRNIWSDYGMERGVSLWRGLSQFLQCGVDLAILTSGCPFRALGGSSRSSFSDGARIQPDSAPVADCESWMDSFSISPVRTLDRPLHGAKR